jgi:hypothetical protein
MKQPQDFNIPISAKNHDLTMYFWENMVMQDFSTSPKGCISIARLDDDKLFFAIPKCLIPKNRFFSDECAVFIKWDNGIYFDFGGLILEKDGLRLKPNFELDGYRPYEHVSFKTLADMPTTEENIKHIQEFVEYCKSVDKILKIAQGYENHVQSSSSK